MMIRRLIRLRINYRTNLVTSGIALLLIMFYAGCVGPEEPVNGLIDNIPVVVNTPEAFTFSLLADDYSTEETFSLNFPIESEKNELAITLVSSEYRASSNDTTAFWVVNSQDSLLHFYRITNNMVIVDTDSVWDRTIPKSIYFKATNFTGMIELVLACDNQQ